MKAKINCYGVIELTPETSEEAYSIEHATNQKEIMIRCCTKDYSGTEYLKRFKSDNK